MNERQLLERALQYIKEYAKNRSVVMYGRHQKIQSDLKESGIKIEKVFTGNRDLVNDKSMNCTFFKEMDGKADQYYVILPFFLPDGGVKQRKTMEKFGYKENEDYIFYPDDNIGDAETLKNMFISLHTQIADLQDKLDKMKAMEEIRNKQNNLLLWSAIKEKGESLDDAKKRFFFSLPKATGGMRMKQLLLYRILEEVDSVCRENNIPYWLDFGSLLGAIRHHGIIPWDDDIDIGMMRADAERLKLALDKNNIIFMWNNYCIDNWNLCNIMRVVYKNYNSNSPVFLDVFIYDYCETAGQVAWNMHAGVRKTLVANTKKYKNNPEEITPYSNMPDGIFHATVVDKEKISKITKEINKAKDELNKHIGLSDEKKDNIIWGIDNFSMIKGVRCFKYDDIFPLREEMFENKKFYIPNKSENILTDRYDDIYTLPDDMLSHEHIKMSEEQKEKLNELYEKIFKKQF